MGLIASTSSPRALPLLPSQEAMLAASLKGQRPQPYVLQITVPLAPHIVADKWDEAWRRVLEAEPILRVAYSNWGLQEIQTDDSPRHVHTWWERIAANFPNDVASELTAIRVAGFSLTEAATVPLQRVDLFIGPQEQKIWALTIHHALVDGASLPILVAKLLAAYRDEATPLETDQRFFRWAEEVLHTDFSGAQQYFAGLRHPLQPAGNLSEFVPRSQIADGEEKSLRVALDLAATPDPLLVEAGLPLSAVLHTAWGMALRQVLGRDVVMFGVTRHARKSAAYPLETALGPFANTLPLAVALDPQRTVLEQLRATRQSALALAAHERCPLRISHGAIAETPDALAFDTLVDIARQTRSAEIAAACGEFAAGPVGFQQSTDIPLSLVAVLEPTLQAVLVANGPLARSETIHQLAELLQQLYAWLCTHPTSRLAEWDTLYAQASVPVVPCSTPTTTILDRWRTTMQQHAGRVALHTPHRRWTFSELWSAAGHVAAAILKQPQESPDAAVPIVGGRTPELIAAQLGVLRAGRAFLIIASDTPQARLGELCDLIGARFVINTAPELTASLPLPALVVEQTPLAIPELAPTSSQLAYLVATSGTTGTPKLVMVEHGSLENLVAAYQAFLAVAPHDVRYQSATVASDTFVLETMLYLSNGASLILDPDLVHRGFDHMNRELCRHGATILGLPSSLWREWASTHLAQPEVAFPVPSLRAMICSMERTDPAVLQAWRAGPGAHLLWINAYGPSEATCVSTAFRLRPGEPTPADDLPIGSDFPNVRTYVLNAQEQPTPPGFVGEIVIGGCGVARGYWRNETATQQAFGPDPFQAGGTARRYRSGDRGYRNERGELVFVGRTDHQVKIRGQRIELEEIEHWLQRHAEVDDAAVVLVQQQGRQELVAFYRAARELAASELVEHLQERLSPALLPQRFLPISAIPRTGLGKIRRSDLVTLAVEMSRIQAASRNIAAPRSPLESRLLAIFRDVLQSDAVGIHDHFFLLGGDSLAAVHLFTELSKGTERTLPLASLLQAPTVAQLASLLSRHGEFLGTEANEPNIGTAGDSAPPAAHASFPAGKEVSSLVVPIQSQGALPRLYCIHGVGGNVLGFELLARHLGTERPVVGIQARGLIPGETPHRSIAAMADDYVRELLRVQPDGPFHLMGQSCGGFIAYEMARRLKALGKTVGLVALLDTTAKQPPRNSAAHAWTQGRFMLRRVTHHAADLWSGSLAQKRERLWRKVHTVHRRAMSMMWRITQRVAPRRNAANRSLAHMLRDVREWCWLAAENYVPSPYAGRVTLFRATERHLSIENDAQGGWAALAKEGVEVLSVPGDHVSLLLEPHVSELARLVRACLEQHESLTRPNVLATASPEVRVPAMPTSVALATPSAALAKRDENQPILTTFSSHGGGSPLVLLPSLGGEIFIWREIAARWSADHPLYALSLASEEAPWSDDATLEEIAEHYLTCLDSFPSDVPIHLAGYSFGGFLAFEIAQQLRASGRAVGRVMIVDTGRGLPSDFSWRNAIGCTLPFLRNVPRWFYENVVCTGPAYWLAEGRRKGTQWWRGWQSRLGGVEQRRTELDDIINTQLFPTPFVKRMSVALRASQQYRPRPYLGQLTLLRATTRPLFSGFAPDLGWGELSRDGVEVMALPGNHDSILKPPHSQALASALCAAIRTGDKAR